MKKLIFNSAPEKKSFLKTSGILNSEIIDICENSCCIIIDSEFPFENNAKVWKMEVVK